MSKRLGPWIEFGRLLIHEIREDQVINGAAALAFFTMLALFPAAIFWLSLLPYLPIPHLRQAIFDLLFQLLPESAAELFTGTVTRIMSARNGGLLSFGLLFAIWSATSGLDAVMQQLNVVYGVTDRRSFLRTRATALLLMLLFLGLLTVTFGLVIFGGVIQDWVANLLGWSAALRGFFALFRWVVIASALLAAFALVYRFAPDVQRPFQLLSSGNLFATAGFLLASFGFRTYVANFASYDATYGGLGAVIVLLLWLFIIGAVILIGGEINDLIERARSRRASAAHALAEASGTIVPMSAVGSQHRSVFISYACEGPVVRDRTSAKQRELRGLAKSDPSIEHLSRGAVLSPRPGELLLHLEVDFRRGTTPKQVDGSLRRLASALLKKDPEARRVYIEANLTDAQAAERQPAHAAQTPPAETT